MPQKLGFFWKMQTLGRADLLPMLANLNEANFEATAQSFFAYQSAHNPIYAQYLKLLGHPPTSNVHTSPFPSLKPIRYKQAFGSPKPNSPVVELRAKNHPGIWYATWVFT